jgi:hypothetical protein
MAKFYIVVALVVLFACPARDAPADNRYAVGADWMLSVRGGVEKRFHPSLGGKADMGLSALGLLVADAQLMLHAFPEEHRYRLALLAGVSNVGIPLSFNAGMVSFGGSVLFGFPVSRRLHLDFHIGAGFPLFFERGEEVVRDIGFPLDLWPDFGLALSW